LTKILFINTVPEININENKYFMSDVI